MNLLRRFARPDFDELRRIEQIILAIGFQQDVRDLLQQRQLHDIQKRRRFCRQPVDTDGRGAVEIEEEVARRIAQADAKFLDEPVEVRVQRGQQAGLYRPLHHDGAVTVQYIADFPGIGLGSVHACKARHSSLPQ